MGGRRYTRHVHEDNSQHPGSILLRLVYLVQDSTTLLIIIIVNCSKLLRR
jgi:hypothetical protein